MQATTLMKAFPNDAEMRRKLTLDYHPDCKKIILSDDFFSSACGAELPGGDTSEFWDY